MFFLAREIPGSSGFLKSSSRRSHIHSTLLCRWLWQLGVWWVYPRAAAMLGGICPEYSQTQWLLLEPLQQGKDRSQGMNKQTGKQETHTLLWIAWIILNLNRTAASSANCRLVKNKHSETCMQIKPRKKKIIEVAKNNQEQDWTNLPKSIQDQDCTHKQANGETSTSGNRKQSSSIVIDSRFLEGPFDSWCVQER